MILNTKFAKYLQDHFFMNEEETMQLQQMHFESSVHHLIDEVVKYLEDNNKESELAHIDAMVATKSTGRMLLKSNEAFLKYIFELINLEPELSALVAKRLDTFDREAFFSFFDDLEEKQQLELLDFFKQDVTEINDSISELKKLKVKDI